MKIMLVIRNSVELRISDIISFVGFYVYFGDGDGLSWFIVSSGDSRPDRLMRWAGVF